MLSSNIILFIYINIASLIGYSDTLLPYTEDVRSTASGGK